MEVEGKDNGGLGGRLEREGVSSLEDESWTNNGGQMEDKWWTSDLRSVAQRVGVYSRPPPNPTIADIADTSIHPPLSSNLLHLTPTTPLPPPPLSLSHK